MPGVPMNFHGVQKMLLMVFHDRWDGTEILFSMLGIET